MQNRKNKHKYTCTLWRKSSLTTAPEEGGQVPPPLRAAGEVPLGVRCSWIPSPTAAHWDKELGAAEAQPYSISQSWLWNLVVLCNLITSPLYGNIMLRQRHLSLLRVCIFLPLKKD